MNVYGTLNNTGTTLALNSQTGNWNLTGGTINGGTITNSTFGLAITTGGTLVADTVAGKIVLNGLFLAGTGVGGGGATLTIQGQVELNGTMVTQGNGVTRFGDAAGANQLVTTTTAHFAFGAFGGHLAQTLVNKGTILAQGGAGQNFNVELGHNSRNEGVIAGPSGASLRVYGATNSDWLNLGTISSTGGTLQLGVQTNETWTNLGTISVTGSVLTFQAGGAAAGKPMTQASIGLPVRDAASTVRMSSSFTLTGGLNLDDTTGSWVIDGTAIRNARIGTTGSAKLIATGSTNTLQNVVLDGQLDLTTYDSAQVVVGGLTLNTTVQVGRADGTQYAQSYTSNSQTITGSGALVFGGNASNVFGGNGSSPTVTIDRGVTLRGSRVRFAGLGGLVNKGTISSDLGGSFDVFPTTFTNQGAVRVGPNSELLLHPVTLTNLTGVTLLNGVRSGTLTGGRWEVAADGTLRVYFDNVNGLQFTRLSADLTLDGANSRVLVGSSGWAYANHDAMGALAAVGGDGRLTLTAGRALSGGAALTNAGTVDLGAGSSLTVAAPVPPPVTGGRLHAYAAEGNANDGTGTNTGVIEGGLTYTAGRTGAGQAFQFNGSNTGVSFGAFAQQGFTIGLWVRPAAGQVTFANILDDRHTGAANFAVYQNNTTNQYIWRVADGSTGVAFNLTANAWQDLTITRDAGTRVSRVYVNGVQVATTTGTVNYDTGTLRLGRRRAVLERGDGRGARLRPRPDGGRDRAEPVGRPARPRRVHAVGRVHHRQRHPGGERHPGRRGAAGASTPGNVIQGNVTNTGGTIAPGNSPDFLDITGDFVQGPDGVLELEIAGRNPNTPEFDRLRVTGTAILDGTLRVALLGGFEPTPGDNYQVLSSSLLTVQPGLRYELPAPGGVNRRLAPVVGSTTLTFQAQQLPPVEFGFATTQTGDLHNREVAVDSFGNTYITGIFFGGAVDLDGEGPAAELTSSAGTEAGFVAKFDAAGNLLWQRKFDGTASQVNSHALALDPTTGDVLFTGVALGVVSITDGTNTATLDTSGLYQAYVVRLTSAGGVLWARATEGTEAFAVGIAVGTSGTIYVAGSFFNTVDFDPSAATSNLTASGGGYRRLLVGARPRRKLRRRRAPGRRQHRYRDRCGGDARRRQGRRVADGGVPRYDDRSCRPDQRRRVRRLRPENLPIGRRVHARFRGRLRRSGRRWHRRQSRSRVGSGGRFRRLRGRRRAVPVRGRFRYRGLPRVHAHQCRCQ